MSCTKIIIYLFLLFSIIFNIISIASSKSSKSCQANHKENLDLNLNNPNILSAGLMSQREAELSRQKPTYDGLLDAMNNREEKNNQQKLLGHKYKSSPTKCKKFQYRYKKS